MSLHSDSNRSVHCRYDRSEHQQRCLGRSQQIETTRQGGVSIFYLASSFLGERQLSYRWFPLDPALRRASIYLSQNGRLLFGTPGNFAEHSQLTICSKREIRRINLFTGSLQNFPMSSAKTAQMSTNSGRNTG